MDAKTAIATKKRALIHHLPRLIDVSINVLVYTDTDEFPFMEATQSERSSSRQKPECCQQTASFDVSWLDSAYKVGFSSCGIAGEVPPGWPRVHNWTG